VGLAAYLLGIENELHVNRHPLRGNLFENLVVIEALKYRYNRGKRSNLHFWRDAKGNEVDLVIESGPDVVSVEIKSGATISDDFFKGLRTFSSRLAAPPRASALVYGGTERQQRSDVGIWRVGDVAEMMGAVCV
jgi:predicted AAA+ superfamily ATPase